MKEGRSSQSYTLGGVRSYGNSRRCHLDICLNYIFTCHLEKMYVCNKETDNVE